MDRLDANEEVTLEEIQSCKEARGIQFCEAHFIHNCCYISIDFHLCITLVMFNIKYRKQQC